MTNIEIQEHLQCLAEIKYKTYSNKLITTQADFIGVSIPSIRLFAKVLAREEDYHDFISCPTYKYYEEYMLSGLTIAYAKEPMAHKLELLEQFISKIDNWSVNDSVAMTVKFKPDEMQIGHDFIMKYIYSKKEYEKRFAIVLLFTNFCTPPYIENTATILSTLTCNHYYTQMATAWGLCECIVKNPDISIPIFINATVDDFTFNKAIQKCRESFRVSKDNKELLLTFKR